MSCRNPNPAARIDITASLKRIAWAYGCTKKDSDEEATLGSLLTEKVWSMCPPQPEGEPDQYSDAWFQRQVMGHPVADACQVDECMVCSWRDCPHAEPLHYHHDGCPCCDDGIVKGVPF